MTEKTMNDLREIAYMLDDILDRDDVSDSEFNRLNKIFHDLDDVIEEVDG